MPPSASIHLSARLWTTHVALRRFTLLSLISVAACMMRANSSSRVLSLCSPCRRGNFSDTSVHLVVWNSRRPASGRDLEWRENGHSFFFWNYAIKWLEGYTNVSMIRSIGRQSSSVPISGSMCMIWSKNIYLLPIIRKHCSAILWSKLTETKLRGFSPQANYTDRGTSACQISLVLTFSDRWCPVVSATDPHGR
jgi:hypothetical protein